ncbi:MAG: hypothetical protein ACRD08_23630 [Acidimicrobiales bacterium]
MIDERARHELYRAVEELLGTERADTLMSLLPPIGWADVATKEDLHQLEARLETRMGARFDRVESRWDLRFNDLESRLLQLDASLDVRFAHAEARADAKFAVVDARFENVEGRFTRVDARFSELEGQLDRSLREQTRTLMLGLVGAMFTMTSLCLGAVALAN